MVDLSERTLRSTRDAAKLILGSNHGVALTGAGISTPSGIPDFRSPGSGLWEKYDPFEVASLNTFRHNPENFFRWMRPIAKKIRDAKPNPAHIGLAHLQNAGYLQTVITQNIDGLHHRASSSNILEIHGTFKSLSCTSCFIKVDASDYTDAYIDRGEIPRCTSCGSILKPNAVLFGEQLPAPTWLKASNACNNCDLMIIAGSSLEVMPVAGLPMRAIENGARLIVINKSKTYIDVRADVVINEDVAQILPHLASEVIDD